VELKFEIFFHYGLAYFIFRLYFSVIYYPLFLSNDLRMIRFEVGVGKKHVCFDDLR